MDWQWVADHLLNQRVGMSLLILALSALLQATAGFGSALFGLPLLLWVGNSLVEAQLLIVTAMLPQNIFGCWRLRRSIDFREVAVPALLRIVALPIGVAGLTVLMNQSKQTVGQVVGVVILLAIGLQYLAGIQWHNARRWPWMLATFCGSGFLQGLMGTGGPPMVLWIHGQKYSIDRGRAFLFATYVIGFIPQVLLLRWNFGTLVWLPMLIAMLAIPLTLLAAEAGLQIGSRLGDGLMRSATYATLAILAIAAIVEPWITN
ncbi:MAG: hypothetical protein KF752_07065 [Pirellulaceae bacterium]|nr:hypothetical protein [Pirellulaceae bacterium]